MNYHPWGLYYGVGYEYGASEIPPEAYYGYSNPYAQAQAMYNTQQQQYGYYHQLYQQQAASAAAHQASYPYPVPPSQMISYAPFQVPAFTSDAHHYSAASNEVASASNSSHKHVSNQANASQVQTETSTSTVRATSNKTTSPMLELMKPKQLASLAIGLSIHGRNAKELCLEMSRRTDAHVTADEAAKFLARYLDEIKQRHQIADDQPFYSPAASTANLVPKASFDGRPPTMWMALEGSFTRSTRVKHAALASEYQVISRLMVQELMKLMGFSILDLVEVLNREQDTDDEVSSESLQRWLEGRLCHIPAVEIAGILSCRWHEVFREQFRRPSIVDVERTIQAWNLGLPGGFWQTDRVTKKEDPSLPKFPKATSALLFQSSSQALDIRKLLAEMLKRNGLTLERIAQHIEGRHDCSNFKPVVTTDTLHAWFTFRNLDQPSVGISGELLIRYLTKRFPAELQTLKPALVPPQRKFKKRDFVRPEEAMPAVQDGELPQDPIFDIGGSEDSGVDSDASAAEQPEPVSGKRKRQKKNLGDVPENVGDKQQYGYLEMFGSDPKSVPLSKLFGVPPKVSPKISKLESSRSKERLMLRLKAKKFASGDPKVSIKAVTDACLTFLQLAVPLKINSDS